MCPALCLPSTFAFHLTFTDKHSDKMSKRMPVGTVQQISNFQPVDNTSLSSLPMSESEDDQQGMECLSREIT